MQWLLGKKRGVGYWKRGLLCFWMEGLVKSDHDWEGGVNVMLLWVMGWEEVRERL